MSEYDKMIAIRKKIDDIESRLTLKTMTHDKRKILIDELDKLWDEYESMLHNAWQVIDPSILEDKQDE